MNIIGIVSVINHVFFTLDSLRVLSVIILMNSAIWEADINTQEPKRVLNNKINI